MTALTLSTRRAPVQVKLHAPATSADKPLRILCATDLWARSDHAVERALALTPAADVMLLHVVQGEAPWRLIARKADWAQTALEWRVRELRRRNAAPAISVRIGKPPALIASVARDWRADLLVLGAYRVRTGDHIVGTTAERLAFSLGLPVLVVNSDAEGPYGDVAIVANSARSAALLERALTQLDLAEPAHSRRRVFYSRALLASDRTQGTTAPFAAALHTVIARAPQLAVVDLDRRPIAARLFGRSMTSALMRSAVCDVLIGSPSGGVGYASELRH